MLSLDEAIEHAREVAKEIRENIIDGENLEPYESYCNAMTEQLAEENEQLAKWLEELKVYQQHEIICNKGYNAGYKKAIDDFERIMCEELKDYIDHKDYMCVGLSLHKFTRDLAEQLKAGGENE